MPKNGRRFLIRRTLLPGVGRNNAEVELLASGEAIRQLLWQIALRHDASQGYSVASAQPACNSVDGQSTTTVVPYGCLAALTRNIIADVSDC